MTAERCAEDVQRTASDEKRLKPCSNKRIQTAPRLRVAGAAAETAAGSVRPDDGVSPGVDVDVPGGDSGGVASGHE